MTYSILFTKGILQGVRREIGEFSFLVLGRGESKCNVSIAPSDAADTSISRKHLTVQIDDKGILVTNHASISGTTLVDGVPVPPNAIQVVKPGSVVTIGLLKSVEFLVDSSRPEPFDPKQTEHVQQPSLEDSYAAMGLQTSLNFSEPPPETEANLTIIGNNSIWR